MDRASVNSRSCAVSPFISVCRDHGQPKRVALQVVSSIIESLCVLELCSAWFVENLRSLTGELLGNRFGPAIVRFASTLGLPLFVAALFEKAAQEEVVFESLHVLLECSRASVDAAVHVVGILGNITLATRLVNRSESVQLRSTH
jgi:hypothetical protein